MTGDELIERFERGVEPDDESKTGFRGKGEESA